MLVLLLALLGVGLEWTGRGEGEPAQPAGELPRTEAVAAPPVTPSADRAEREPEPAPARQPASAGTMAGPVSGPGRENGEVAAPLVEGGAPSPAEAVASPVVVGPARIDFDPDRFASLASAVETGIAQHRFGEARLTLDLLAALPLGREQARECDRLELEFEAGVGALCREVVASVRDGEVLAARALVARAREGSEETRRALGAALASAGVGARVAEPPGEPRERWPLPAPLPRERLVRATTPGRTVVGRVVDSRSDRVTLRVETQRAVTFPTVPRVGCEPIDPSAGEAAEQGFAALLAGDVILARLWLACALLRPPGEDARTLRLAQLLR